MEWLKQDDETNKAYLAFCAYRDMDHKERSLAEAYRQYKNKPEAKQAAGAWTNWYTKHGWRARAEAYDLHLDEIARAEARDQRRQQIKNLNALLAMAMRSVHKTLDNGHAVSIRELVSLAKLALTEQREEFDDKASQRLIIDYDLTRCSDEQLQRIASGESPAVVLSSAS